MVGQSPAVEVGLISMSRATEIRCARAGNSASVAIRVWLRGGMSSENQPGLALLTGRMLAEGTTSRSWDRIASEAEALGMDISTSAVRR